MIQEVKTYACDKTPQDDDIKQAMEIARGSGVIVKLCWHVKYSGSYSVYVTAQSTLESVKAQMPRSYGI